MGETMADITEQQPERFKRAMQAGCMAILPQYKCTYPDCQCDELYATRTKFARAFVLAWEAPQHLPDK